MSTLHAALATVVLVGVWPFIALIFYLREEPYSRHIGFALVRGLLIWLGLFGLGGLIFAIFSSFRSL